jgi:hypothetical protein
MKKQNKIPSLTPPSLAPLSDTLSDTLPEAHPAVVGSPFPKGATIFFRDIR